LGGSFFGAGFPFAFAAGGVLTVLEVVVGLETSGLSLFVVAPFALPGVTFDAAPDVFNLGEMLFFLTGTGVFELTLGAAGLLGAGLSEALVWGLEAATGFSFCVIPVFAEAFAGGVGLGDVPDFDSGAGLESATDFVWGAETVVLVLVDDEALDKDGRGSAGESLGGPEAVVMMLGAALARRCVERDGLFDGARLGGLFVEKLDALLDMVRTVPYREFSSVLTLSQKVPAAPS
jgi:hypothetical protein